MSTVQITHDGMAGGNTVAGEAGPTYIEVQQGSEFIRLRRGFRQFVFPVTALFLAWYFLYVVLAAFAPDFMGIEVIGKINIGLLFGLGQFVSTFTITMIYVRWADKEFDSTAERLRKHMETGLSDDAPADDDRAADDRAADDRLPRRGRHEAHGHRHATDRIPAPLDGGERL